MYINVVSMSLYINVVSMSNVLTINDCLPNGTSNFITWPDNYYIYQSQRLKHFRFQVSSNDEFTTDFVLCK